MRRRGLAAAAAVVASLLLAGCAEQAPTDQVTVGPGGGVVSEWKQPTTPAVTFGGPTVSGGTFDSKQYLGKVVVANFWYAGCGPCRGEAKALNTVAADASKDVQFVGVNISDSRVTAQGFVSDFQVPYPSILDEAGGGRVQSPAFARNKPVGAIPSTLVLDRKGRVVARIVGAADPNILKTLIQDAVDGTAA